MQDEIGTEAAVIWQALNGKSGRSLVQLKKEVKGKSPLFEWAIGWLAREDKIVITREKRSFRLELRTAHSQGASGQSRYAQWRTHYGRSAKRRNCPREI